MYSRMSHLANCYPVEFSVLQVSVASGSLIGRCGSGSIVLLETVSAVCGLVGLGK